MLPLPLLLFAFPPAPAAALPSALARASEGAAPLFREVGARALPGVSTTCGTQDKRWIVEVDGGGVALADFDGDDALDLVVVDGSTVERVRAGEPGFPPRLFLGKGDGSFAPAPESWAMKGGRWGMGCAVGDVNEDGWLDLVVTEWGPDRLFLNDGGKGFVERTEGCGFQGERWGTSAAFLDYDRDGHLDLAVVNYLAFDPERIEPDGCRWKNHAVMCGPEGLVPVHDQLYRGRGDGTFEEVTLQAGYRPESAGFGLGIMSLDYDGDGDTDLYVTNDSTPNHLWENRGDGTFAEVGFRRGASHDANGKEQAGMGIACADLAGDGKPALFVTNFSGESNSLYVRGGGAGFRERAATSGLGAPSLRLLGWGTGFVDADLDGDLDLFVFNGHVYPQADLPGTDTSYRQPDQLFVATDGRFEERALSDAGPGVSRAACAGDLDRDGDLDLVAIGLDGPVRVLESLAPHGDGRHWLEVALRGRRSNRFGLGARVRAEWEGGQRTVEVRTAGGFQAAVPPEAHFGLGPVSRLERLVVSWPSGTEQVLRDVDVDRRLVLEEPAE